MEQDADTGTRRDNEIRERADLYQHIVEEWADVVTLIAADGTIIFASRSLADLDQSLGYAPEELVGTNALDLIHPRDRASVAKAISNDLAGVPTTVEARVRRKSGAWVSTELRGKAIAGTDGKPVALTSGLYLARH